MLYNSRKKDHRRYNLRCVDFVRLSTLLDQGINDVGTAYGKLNCVASLHGIPPRTVIPDLVFCNLLCGLDRSADSFVLDPAEKI